MQRPGASITRSPILREAIEMFAPVLGNVERHPQDRRNSQHYKATH
jgi:hypothetical protein